jgi:hypothetical protein
MDEAAAWLVARISSIYGVAAQNIATDSIKEFVSRPHLRALYVQPGSACAKHFEDAPPPDDKAGDTVGGSHKVSSVSYGVLFWILSLHFFFFSIWVLMLSLIHTSFCSAKSTFAGQLHRSSLHPRSHPSSLSASLFFSQLPST